MHTYIHTNVTVLAYIYIHIYTCICIHMCVLIIYIYIYMHTVETHPFMERADCLLGFRFSAELEVQVRLRRQRVPTLHRSLF